MRRGCRRGCLLRSFITIWLLLFSLLAAAQALSEHNNSAREAPAPTSLPRSLITIWLLLLSSTAKRLRAMKTAAEDKPRLASCTWHTERQRRSDEGTHVAHNGHSRGREGALGLRHGGQTCRSAAVSGGARGMHQRVQRHPQRGWTSARQLQRRLHTGGASPVPCVHCVRCATWATGLPYQTRPTKQRAGAAPTTLTGATSRPAASLGTWYSS